MVLLEHRLVQHIPTGIPARSGWFDRLMNAGRITEGSPETEWVGMNDLFGHHSLPPIHSVIVPPANQTQGDFASRSLFAYTS